MKQKFPKTPGAATQMWRREMKAAGSTRDERVALLRKWAEVRVTPKRERSLAESRAAFKACFRAPKVAVGECWVCSGWADLIRHHVVQLQHGGPNTNINLVRICGECHVAIHPWLDMPAERTRYA